MYLKNLCRIMSCCEMTTVAICLGPHGPCKAYEGYKATVGNSLNGGFFSQEFFLQSIGWVKLNYIGKIY